MTARTSFATALLAAVTLSGLASAQTPTREPQIVIPLPPVIGGTNGRVIEVTSLSDEGPGTLREALNADGPRTVTFKVAGEIRISRPLVINDPYITVAGETAPSPGITVMGDKIRILTRDVILRHIRLRVGETGGSKPDNRDGFSIESYPEKKRPAYNILIENCSVSWAIDENIGLFGMGVRNVQVRNSIIAEALRHSIHPKGGHSMGMLIGRGAQNVLVEGNLFAHNAYRNPVVDGGTSAVIVNNLIYNPGTSAVHFYPKPKAGGSLASVVNNVVIAGPDTKPWLRAFTHGLNEGTRIHYGGNRVIGTRTLEPDERVGRVPLDVAPMEKEPPLWFIGMRPLPAAQVEASVLEKAGARPWDRDAVDRRIIEDVRNRTGEIRDHPSDVRLIARPPVE